MAKRASKVSTGKLGAGTVVRVPMPGDARVKLEGKPEVTERGTSTWYAWRNMPIVSGAIEGCPEATVWTIQGDGQCFWSVSSK